MSAAEEEARAAQYRAQRAARVASDRARAAELAGDAETRAELDEAFAPIVAAQAETQLGDIPFEAPPPVPKRHLLPPGVAPPAWWGQR